jgi:hypothetical protein
LEKNKGTPLCFCPKPQVVVDFCQKFEKKPQVAVDFGLWVIAPPRQEILATCLSVQSNLSTVTPLGRGHYCGFLMQILRHGIFARLSLRRRILEFCEEMAKFL